jgi:Aldo/keto reductase family
MNKQLLNRRQFNGLCVTLGSSFYSVGTMVVALSSASTRAATPTVKFADGTIVPALGQGSAGLAQGRHPEAAEEDALRTGLSLGMTLIDTAEMYGDGRSEKLVGDVIAGLRSTGATSPGSASFRMAPLRRPRTSFAPWGVKVAPMGVFVDERKRRGCLCGSGAASDRPAPPLR